jgi:DNA-binding GntR family transcriptional regulator
VETASARLAVARAGDADLAALRELLNSSLPAADEEESVRAGSDFHLELARLSGNNFMVDGVRSAMLRLARTRWLEVRTPASRHQAWSEHQQILEAVARRDAQAAAELIGEHIRSTNARLVRRLDDQRRSLRFQGLSIVGDAGGDVEAGAGHG